MERKGLRQELRELLTSLGFDYLKNVIDGYIQKYGEEGIMQLAYSDTSLLEYTKGKRPELLVWLDKARRLKGFIELDPEVHGQEIISYLERKGLHLDDICREWVVKQLRIIKEELGW
jgi:hypothetical protein